MPLKLFGGKGQDRGRSDVTARPHGDNDVRCQRLHELAVLSLFLHSAGTMEEMMALFLERSPRVTGALLTYPLLLDKRRNILVAEHLSSVDDPGLERASMAANENFADLELPLPLRSWHRSVMDGGEVVLCDLDQVLGAVLGAQACESVRKTLGVTHVAVAPLVMEGESFGICVFVFSGEQPDVELLELVAGHCTLALKGLATGEEATRFGGVDQVTWAHGRAYFLETLDAELARAKRFGRSVGLIILDIDDFGEFNANYGHTMGDRLLRAVAMNLAAPLVAPEFVARYGSDEFVILLPESSRAETLQDSRRIIRGLAGLSVFEDDAQAPGLSVSSAVVSFPEDGSSRDELLAAAEHELARAKESRRAEMLRGEAAA